MLTLLSVLLLFIPTIFQYIIGTKSLSKSIKIKFGFVCLISIILQFGITILSFGLIVYDIRTSGTTCAIGAVGALAISFGLFICTLMVIIIQCLNRNTYR